MACTYSVAMAEVTRASTLETNLNQPGYLETKDTPPPDQGENYPTQAESKPEPQPETPQDPGTDQPPATHEPEAKDDTYSPQTDHVETLTPVEVNTNLIQGVNAPDGHRAEVSAPSDEEQVYATAQTKMALPTLSRDTDLAEEAPAEPVAAPILVAMAEQPAAVTPGTMQQNMLNSNKQAT